MIISIAVQNIPVKVWMIPLLLETFILVTISFYYWIKKISPAVNMGEPAYFYNHEGCYFDTMPSVWKNMRVIEKIEVIFITDFFAAKTYHGKSLWIK